MLDLIALDGNALRNHVPEQEAQLRDVPLPIAQLEERLPDCLVAVDLEGLEERSAGAQDAAALIKQEQRARDGVDDALGLHVFTTQKAVDVFQVHGRSRSTGEAILVQHIFTLPKGQIRHS